MSNFKLYLISILYLFSIINIAHADDNFYSISNNTLLNNNYKIIFDKSINMDSEYSGILIDNSSLYVHTNENFYIINKTTGEILYKLMIQNIKNKIQTDNFIYLQTDYNIYKINKTSGNIDEKRIYIYLLKNIYSFFGVSGISGSTIINNYYDCGNCTNGTNGLNGTDGAQGPQGPQGPQGIQGPPGINGTNGIDGINGTNGTNGINGTNGLNGEDGAQGIPGINGTNGINQSDETKINKTGDIVGDNFRLNTSSSGTMQIRSSDITLQALNTAADYGVIRISNDLILLDLYNDTNMTNTNYYFDSDKLNMGGKNINEVNNINMSGDLNLSGNNISSVNTLHISNGINMISRVYNTTYSVNTTATATGVLTVNVSNSVGSNNDTLIYLNGHANANFSDVFFTQNNAVIPFTHTETNLSVFYINVTTLDFPVFLNYGNPSVDNIGNGNATVDIYADGSSLEKFDANDVTLSNGNISIAANAAGGNYLTTKIKLQRPSVAVYDLTVPAFYSLEGFSNTAGLQNEANANQIFFYAAGDNNFYSEYRGASSASTVNIGARTTTEHVQKLLWRNSSTDTKFYIDGIQKTSPAANFPTLTELYFSISAHSTFNVANILIDNILIYKYSDGKFNNWGTETANSVPIEGNVYCIFVDAAGNVQSSLGAC